MLKKENIIMLVVFILIILVLIFIYKKDSMTNDYDFNIYFFNAGKADAIILSKNDKYMMIDTGEESLGEEILKYFKNNNINRLEYLVITHFDKDHIGSASSIIDNIEIGEVLQSNYPKESKYYDNYINSLSIKGIAAKTISGNYKINLDDLDITILGPQIIYDNNESNNSSLLVSVIDNENSFLFMGDSQNSRIKDFIKNNTSTYDFIKIPYHGNYLKQLDNLLDNTKAKYAVLTCSSTEGCEKETLELLDNYNIKYYLTKNGSISVFSNGTNIKIKQ